MPLITNLQVASLLADSFSALSLERGADSSAVLDVQSMQEHYAHSDKLANRGAGAGAAK